MVGIYHPPGAYFPTERCEGSNGPAFYLLKTECFNALDITIYSFHISETHILFSQTNLEILYWLLKSCTDVPSRRY